MITNTPTRIEKLLVVTSVVLFIAKFIMLCQWVTFDNIFISTLVAIVLLSCNIAILGTICKFNKRMRTPSSSSSSSSSCEE